MGGREASVGLDTIGEGLEGDWVGREAGNVSNTGRKERRKRRRAEGRKEERSVCVCGRGEVLWNREEKEREDDQE